MSKFMSPEWAKAFKEALNTNPAYAEAARNWEGDFYFTATDMPGDTKTSTMYADLWHGKCREAFIVTGGDDEREPAFRMTGTMPVWKKVVEKKLDPIQGLLTRQLKLQGDMVTIMRNVKSAQALVNSLATIDTEFPS